MKKIGMALISFIICLCVSGSIDRGEETSAQTILQISQNAQTAISENRDVSHKNSEVMEEKNQEYLSAIENERAVIAKEEIEDIKNKEKYTLVYESNLSDKREEVYKDENGDLYCYNDAGEVIDFTANIENINCRSIKPSEEEVKEAADIYLENLVETPSYYQLGYIEYNECVNYNFVIYNHKINDLNTTDLVLVILDNGLNLISFSIPRAYAFQEMESIKIDVEKIKQEALDRYFQIYGNSVENVKVENFQIGTDDDENLGYQVDICGKGMNDVERYDIPETIFIPYQNDN